VWARPVLIKYKRKENQHTLSVELISGISGDLNNCSLKEKRSWKEGQRR
jgi:hypothetical protein